MTPSQGYAYQVGAVYRPIGYEHRIHRVPDRPQGFIKGDGDVIVGIALSKQPEYLPREVFGVVKAQTKDCPPSGILFEVCGTAGRDAH